VASTDVDDNDDDDDGDGDAVTFSYWYCDLYLEMKMKSIMHFIPYIVADLTVCCLSVSANRCLPALLTLFVEK